MSNGTAHIGNQPRAKRHLFARVALIIGSVILFLVVVSLPDIIKNHLPAGEIRSLLLEFLPETGILVIGVGFLFTALGAIIFREPITEYFNGKITDLTNKVVTEINTGYDKISNAFSRRVGQIDAELVNDWAARGEATEQSYKTAGIACLHQYYSQKLGYHREYVDGVVSDLLNAWIECAPRSWRETLVTDITLGKDRFSKLPDRGLITWDETNTYTLVVPHPTGTLMLPAMSVIDATPDNLQELLHQAVLTIVAGPLGGKPVKIYDLSTLLPQINIPELVRDSRKELENTIITYNGSSLTIDVKYFLEVKHERTQITIRQKTLMEPTDRSYLFVNTTPTRGITFIMRLANLDDWEFSSVMVSAAFNYEGASQNVGITKNDRDSFIRTISGWVFPGSAIGTQWRPRQSAGVSDGKVVSGQATPVEAA